VFVRVGATAFIGFVLGAARGGSGAQAARAAMLED
jgi:hypothetical protein